MKNTNAALERIELAKWCKRAEIESLAKAGGRVSKSHGVLYAGMAIGFAQVWAHIVFDGITPSAWEYDKADAAWTDMVNEK